LGFSAYGVCQHNKYGHNDCQAAKSPESPFPDYFLALDRQQTLALETCRIIFMVMMMVVMMILF
jgi:hypothetical protein